MAPACCAEYTSPASNLVSLQNDFSAHLSHCIGSAGSLPSPSRRHLHPQCLEQNPPPPSPYTRVNATRNRAVPTGTVGGRIALTSNPRVRNLLPNLPPPHPPHRHHMRPAPRSSRSSAGQSPSHTPLRRLAAPPVASLRSHRDRRPGSTAATNGDAAVGEDERIAHDLPESL